MPYALITGASKGIGKEIARELAKKKYDLVLTARSEKLLQQFAEELQQQYKVVVQYLAVDLSKAEAPAQITTFITERKLPISMLVNNAGYGLWGRFEKLKLSEQLNMLRLNNESLISLTYELLPVLKQQERSYILNIASTASYQAMPYMSVYAASKAFVVSFSRGLSGELRGSSVSVTCVSPGATGTYFMEVAGMNTNKKLLNMAAKVEMTAEDVAVESVDALFARKVEFIAGVANKITAFANNFLPKSLVEKVVGNIYKVD